jgi:hypothetical protein
MRDEIWPKAFFCSIWRKQKRKPDASSNPLPAQALDKVL